MADQDLMTHSASMAARPYMHPNVPPAAAALAGFLRGGLQGAGAPLPGWAQSNPVQQALQNPDNEAVLGMGRPWGYWGNEGLPILRKAIEAGKTQREIAAEHGIDQSTVAQIMKKYNLQSANVRGPRPKGDEEIAKLKGLIDQGETWQSIADKLGRKSAGSVRNLANRYGLTGDQSFGITPEQTDWAELPGGVRQKMIGTPAPSAPAASAPAAAPAPPPPGDDPEMAQLMTNYMRKMGIIE